MATQLALPSPAHMAVSGSPMPSVSFLVSTLGMLTPAMATITTPTDCFLW